LAQLPISVSSVAGHCWYFFRSYHRSWCSGRFSNDWFTCSEMCVVK